MTRDLETLRAWLRACLILATVASCSLPIVYSFSPWRSRPVGRVIMLLSVSLASAMVLSTLFAFWSPSEILIRFWVNIFVIFSIAISTSATAIMIWRLNHPRRRRKPIMLFTGVVYDVLKKLAQIWLPALGTFYFAVGQIWGLPSTEEVVGTVMAVDTFLGLCLGISTKTYNETDARFDGHVVIEEHDGESTMRLKNVDVQALDTKDELRLKLTR